MKIFLVGLTLINIMESVAPQSINQKEENPVVLATATPEQLKALLQTGENGLDGDPRDSPIFHWHATERRLVARTGDSVYFSCWTGGEGDKPIIGTGPFFSSGKMHPEDRRIFKGISSSKEELQTMLDVLKERIGNEGMGVLKPSEEMKTLENHITDEELETMKGKLNQYVSSDGTHASASRLRDLLNSEDSDEVRKRLEVLMNGFQDISSACTKDDPEAEMIRMAGDDASVICEIDSFQNMKEMWREKLSSNGEKFKWVKGPYRVRVRLTLPESCHRETNYVVPSSLNDVELKYW